MTPKAIALFVAFLLFLAAPLYVPAPEGVLGVYLIYGWMAAVGLGMVVFLAFGIVHIIRSASNKQART